MDQIHQGKIKMRPRIYFIVGSLFVFLGLVSTILVSVFFVGLIRFSLRSHGPMGEYRIEQLITSFPWWAPVVAIFGSVFGLWLIRRYDFSYKINFKVIIVGFLMAVVAAGWLVDVTGLNDALVRRGPMRGMMKQYFQENNIQPHRGWNSDVTPVSFP